MQMKQKGEILLSRVSNPIIEKGIGICCTLLLVKVSDVSYRVKLLIDDRLEKVSQQICLNLVEQLSFDILNWKSGSGYVGIYRTYDKALIAFNIMVNRIICRFIESIKWKNCYDSIISFLALHKFNKSNIPVVIGSQDIIKCIAQLIFSTAKSDIWYRGEQAFKKLNHSFILNK